MTDRQPSIRPGFLDLLHSHVANAEPRVVDDDALAQAAVALIVAPDPFSILFIKRATSGSGCRPVSRSTG